MKIKHFFIYSLLFTMILITSCSKPVPEKFSGTISLVVGKAEIKHQGITRTLKTGDNILPGDIIKTGPDSVVIAILGSNLAQMEIQENAQFYFKGNDNSIKDLYLKQGNLWLRINKKMQKGQEFRVHSPTAVAAVRGTKFYTFKVGNIHGTCVCNGSIHYDVKNQNFSGVENKDRLILTRGKQTVSFVPDNMPQDGTDPHRHSALDNSPLGPKTQMSKNKMDAFIHYLDSKLKNTPDI